ncbi:sulfatase family protein [Pelagicoccus mobilis]|uniref:Sulfatase-like hydrolase/transferase n=1 Tax=Pelagicoccus mobilis TaxID=415221 RepID=A0A934RVP0_9BACT|nr:sulfatase-like hydrolase/transferase [Pelagicoccus mobilis]MBK1877243.1 sulfatase-like hydrolase/transferase [Pelagicoccus mobilis]
MNEKPRSLRITATLVSIALPLFFVTFSLAGEPDSSGGKPNILLILVDDLGYGDLACYGAPDMRTPNFDRLMESGMRFDQFYANCTVCSPTRAALLTGRYQDKVGVPGVIRQNDDSWGRLDPNTPTLPNLLKQANYHTGIVGKWHLGYEKPNIPNSRGFDHFYGFLGDMMDDYWTHLRGDKNWMRYNEEVIQPKGHATEVFTEAAIHYLEKQAAHEDPFFLYLAYNAPHFPIQPPEEWLEKVRNREPHLSEKRAKNVAFIEHLDHHIGRVLKSIESLGIQEETLVIFTSDNGGALPYEQRNLPLRGGKQDHWEGGIRVPTCVVWPGKIPAQRSSEPGMTMDLFPTLCEIAGVEVSHPIDGQSLLPIWLEGEAADPERVMVWVRREGGSRGGRAYYAIRKGKWKLLQNDSFEAMQLVDLEADPLETNPTRSDNKVSKELNWLLMRHIQEAGKVPWQ